MRASAVTAGAGPVNTGEIQGTDAHGAFAQHLTSHTVSAEDMQRLNNPVFTREIRRDTMRSGGEDGAPADRGSIKARRRTTAPRHPKSPAGRVEKRDVFKNVRFAQWEGDLVETAARRVGLKWSTFAREIILQTSAAVIAGPAEREALLAGLRGAASVIAEGMGDDLP